MPKGQSIIPASTITINAVRWRIAALALPALTLLGAGTWGWVALQRHAEADMSKQAYDFCRFLAERTEAALEESSRLATLPRLFDNPPTPQEVTPAWTDLQNALQLGQPAALQKVADAPGDSLSPAGLPVRVLALHALWKMSGDIATGTALREAALHSAPSVLTPLVLGELEPAPEAPWHREWGAQTRVRSFIAAHQALLTQPPPFPGVEVTETDGIWRITRSADGGPAIIGPAQADAIVERVCDEVAALRPAWLEVTVRSFGGELTMPNTTRPLLAEARGPVAVRGWLSANGSSAPPYQWALGWFGAVLALAAVTLVAALISTQRSWTQERTVAALRAGFVASVSHELRAPLASMRLLAENLEAGIVTAPDHQRDCHRMIVDECRRLGTLVENVLDLSRLEHGRHCVQRRETDLPALVLDTVQLMQLRAEQRSVSLLCEVAEGDICPEVDAAAMQQALINLLDNALKHSPPGGRVKVIVDGDADHYTISVSDQGPGIPAADRERIFLPFHRLGNEQRRETEGTGLGLAIVAAIASGHDAMIQVENASGGGARFVLRGPARSDGKVDSPRPGTSPQS